MRSTADILDEDVVPRRELVAHREAELDRLLERLRPIDDVLSPVCFLTGPTGTGKTMLARLVLQLLRQNHNVRTCYLNCWSEYERRPILYHVASDLSPEAVDRDTDSTAQLAEAVQATPTVPRYLVLDEADQLHDTGVLYDLHEAPDLHLILVANDEQALFSGLEDRIQSRLSVTVRIECDRYSADELATILEKRADHAVHSRRYDRQILEYVATRADGDARTAIRTLREVVMNTDGPIDRADVDEAVAVARDYLRQKNLTELNRHQRAVYEVVADADGYIPTSTIYERYCERVDDARADRRVRTYLKKLTQYDLLVRDDGGSEYEYAIR